MYYLNSLKTTLLRFSRTLNKPFSPLRVQSRYEIYEFKRLFVVVHPDGHCSVIVVEITL